MSLLASLFIYVSENYYIMEKGAFKASYD